MSRPTVEGRLESLIRKHGSLRALSRYIGVAPSYISRLRRGLLNNPKDSFLEKIGLEVESRVVTYRSTKKWERQQGAGEAPAEQKAPRPDNRRQCTCAGTCRLADDPHAILGRGWRCAMGRESIPGHTGKAQWAHCETPRKDAK